MKPAKEYLHIVDMEGPNKEYYEARIVEAIEDAQRDAVLNLQRPVVEEWIKEYIENNLTLSVDYRDPYSSKDKQIDLLLDGRVLSSEYI